jgi:hypothetical protein
MPRAQTSTLPTGAEFSAKRAKKAITFIEKMTVHTKSVWQRKPFVLEPWQKGSAWKDPNTGLWRTEGIIAPLFGTVKYSPFWGKYVRQFNTAWIEMARKSR